MGGAMSQFEGNKRWSDKFIPYIADAIGRVLIVPAPFEEDAQRNTDLVVLRMDSVRIGCRVRRHEYFNNYSDEFTIRASLPSGTKTELTKIIEGWGDFFFYGFSNADETGLEKWTLADFNVFRLWFNRHLFSNKGQLPGKPRTNNDKSSDFMVFKWEDLPGDFIVDSSERRFEGGKHG